METLIYWRLLDEHSQPFRNGDDNPAGIPNQAPVQSAKRMALYWMRHRDVRHAKLVKNGVKDGCDNILKTYDMTL